MAIVGCPDSATRKAQSQIAQQKSELNPNEIVQQCGYKVILTEEEVEKLFEELSQNSEIPFEYVIDCCFAKAHKMYLIIKSKNILAQKYWLFEKDFDKMNIRGDLKPRDQSGKPLIQFGHPVEFGFHVAPIVKVAKNDGTVEDYILDPSIANQPITKNELKNIMGNPPGLYEEISHGEAYYQNQKNGHVKGASKFLIFPTPYQEDPEGKKTTMSLHQHTFYYNNMKNINKNN